MLVSKYKKVLLSAIISIFSLSEKVFSIDTFLPSDVDDSSNKGILKREVFFKYNPQDRSYKGTPVMDVESGEFLKRFDWYNFGPFFKTSEDLKERGKELTENFSRSITKEEYPELWDSCEKERLSFLKKELFEKPSKEYLLKELLQRYGAHRDISLSSLTRNFIDLAKDIPNIQTYEELEARDKELNDLSTDWYAKLLPYRKKSATNEWSFYLELFEKWNQNLNFSDDVCKLRDVFQKNIDNRNAGETYAELNKIESTLNSEYNINFCQILKNGMLDSISNKIRTFSEKIPLENQHANFKSSKRMAEKALVEIEKIVENSAGARDFLSKIDAQYLIAEKALNSMEEEMAILNSPNNANSIRDVFWKRYIGKDQNGMDTQYCTFQEEEEGSSFKLSKALSKLLRDCAMDVNLNIKFLWGKEEFKKSDKSNEIWEMFLKEHVDWVRKKQYDVQLKNWTTCKERMQKYVSKDDAELKAMMDDWFQIMNSMFDAKDIDVLNEKNGQMNNFNQTWHKKINPHYYKYMANEWMFFVKRFEYWNDTFNFSDDAKALNSNLQQSIDAMDSCTTWEDVNASSYIIEDVKKASTSKTIQEMRDIVVCHFPKEIEKISKTIPFEHQTEDFKKKKEGAEQELISIETMVQKYLEDPLMENSIFGNIIGSFKTLKNALLFMEEERCEFLSKNL